MRAPSRWNEQKVSVLGGLSGSEAVVQVVSLTTSPSWFVSWIETVVLPDVP